MDEPEHFSSRDSELLPTTFTFELDPDMVKVNQRNTGHFIQQLLSGHRQTDKRTMISESGPLVIGKM